ncbi:MAG: DUF1801 domain-containing protein [Gemmatimonadota bacterium]|nr:DUF1801 domain-containing protein [Gemmatimonadota bacterium]
MAVKKRTSKATAGPTKPRAVAGKSKSAGNKTVETAASVTKFLAGLKDPQRAEDSQVVLGLMRKISKIEPRMWGSSIVGFGSCHYRYDSGREGDMPRIGFSPRKEALTLYLPSGFPRYAALMAKLGNHKAGKSCLYIKRLADVDLKVLESLVSESWRYMATRYPDSG